MRTPNLNRRWAMPLASLLSAVLAACGGGGSTDDATRVAPLAVKVDAPTIGKEVAARVDQTSNRASNRLYIVQLAEAPAAAYEGGIAGYKATKPAQGKKLDSSSPDVSSYVGYLNARHDTLLASVGGARKAYSYGYVFNGFAAELTEMQAAKLAMSGGVISVTKDEKRKLDTATTPAFLGLSTPGGFWSTAGKGEGVVIGIVDSGIWPEHPSLSDRTDTNGNGTQDGKLGYQQIPGWNGKCTPGEAFNASDCNQKLIAAQYYNAGYGGNAGVKANFPYEFASPRDFDGHGTHTATTAGGNQNVQATGPASVFGKVSGIAPRARIAAYKVCWGNGLEGGCFSTDSVAAIDQAVADGVDVINFSISGSQTNFLDPVEVAFLFAADAGVFVAASAGNSGPASSTVAHPSPWLTTVAAGTHNREVNGSVTLGNGATYAGASSAATGVGPAPLVRSIDAGLAGADATALALCFTAEENGGSAVLDPAKVAGKIVVCDRGVNARVSKSTAVQAAGGVGMVLVNTGINSLNADFHAVPTVHLQSTDRAAVNAYAATAGATASISPSVLSTMAAAPFTASFSSRGPLLAGGGSLLKPDLIAPGQDILAGVAPPNYGGRLFDLLSGTSMSSPHVAGIAALFKEAKPGWSPMAIKSALMTSAGDVLDGGTPAPTSNPVLIFRQGAGHVRPNNALDPGLVFDSSWNDWLAFLCEGKLLVAGTCTALRNAGYSTDAGNFNSASIALGAMAGSVTVTRTVTNVSKTASTYNASVSGMAGMSVSVSPASFTIAAGAKQKLRITVTRTSAALNTYTGGQLTLADAAAHVVRVPMVVRPVALSAPAQVNGNGAALNYDVTFGFSGPFGASPVGLVPAAVTAGVVADDPTDSTCSLSSPNAQLIPVSIPAGTTYARFSLFDADVNAGSDLDMCVFNGSTLVGASGSGTSAEEVSLSNPAAGTYTVVVQGWGVVGSSPFKLHSWLLDGSSAGNMTVGAPATATTGATGTVSLGFTGLAAATRYLGAVTYSGSTGLPTTIVRIDTP